VSRALKNKKKKTVVGALVAKRDCMISSSTGLCKKQQCSNNHNCQLSSQQQRNTNHTQIKATHINHIAL
jgi:hypothetical protein